ncbi:beta-galactosidase [Agromyces seonyuensis]|uniref:Beta-galactosidase n=1 Tax=Agromyces seonyuensis TaxID=2662446 RepID=A0A6I4NRY0_9MICO|nr:beta-galactosidase [Agromyces seonyuensis]MWB96970.1 beta-galactosidase [Agromyces seonyuensis]
MANEIDARPGLALTSRSLVRNGRPWIPVSGELHYSRVPRERWRERLQLMRSGGIDVVATYVFWLHHQPQPGEARFDGRLDVAEFIRLCAELELELILRIGPWCHGEARNGGFPDWVQAAPVAHRTDDPGYLELVADWFARLSAEIAPLCGPDGPIIGIQIENELYDQPQHLATLKGMARELGMTAPLYTATAWGGAELPGAELFPLYSGYGDGFWVDADAPWDATFRQHFFFSDQWDDPGVGADVRGVDITDVAVKERDDRFPPATCELGGGMATPYHRRVVPAGADIAAVANAKLGSGSAWQGYYMYAGGTNPADRGPMQESHETGYPNDLPVFDYDFHAAIGAAGDLGPSHSALRRQHAFIAAFGAELAGMPASFPDASPSGPEDATTLRWALRSDGRRGFVFVNWHQPHVPLPPRHGVRFRLELPGGERTIGGAGLDIRPGVVARWPFGLDVGGVELLWASASALTVLGEDTLVLVADSVDDVRFAVDPGVDVVGAELGLDGAFVVDGETGGLVELVRGDARGTLLVVGHEDAERVWVLERPHRRLLRSASPIWSDGDRLGVRSASLPAVSEWRGAWMPLDLAAEATGTGRDDVAILQTRDAGEPSAGYGTFAGRPSAPDTAWRAGIGATWRLGDLGAPVDGLRRTLEVVWAGDVAELLVDDVVVADRFWDGTVWRIDLDALDGAVADRAVIRITPIARESPVWLAPAAADRLRAGAAATASLDGVVLVRSAIWRA